MECDDVTAQFARGCCMMGTFAAPSRVVPNSGPRCSIGIMMPKIFSDPDAIAEDIIRDVGNTLVVGLPLGLGKANHIINALYRRAVADRSIKLILFSALTLEKPRPSNELE